MIHESDKYNVPSGDLDDIIPADEPVFLLRGKDRCAYALILEWLHRNKSMDPGKYNRLLAHANKMKAYSEAHKRIVDTVDFSGSSDSVELTENQMDQLIKRHESDKIQEKGHNGQPLCLCSTMSGGKKCRHCLSEKEGA